MHSAAMLGKYYSYMADCMEMLQIYLNGKKVLLGIAVSVAFCGILSRLSARRKSQQLLRKIAKKRSQCAESFRHVREALPTSKDAVAKQDKIVSLSVEDLLQQLREDKLNPVEVLQAYQSAALKAHEKTNCLIEPFLEALTWAQNLKSSQKGLLYGLPIAMKDDFGVKGYESTLGCAQFIGKFVKEDCAIVTALKSEGAIPFVKTNAAQCLLSAESSNPIFGLTVNAHDTTRGAGGSSGGTGALVACRGSPIGTGSDIGGSIRIPSAFNGMCGFKPTPQRVSQKGCESKMDKPFPDLVPWSYGPISPTVAGAVIFMKAIWSGRMFEEDPYVSPIPFQENVFTSMKPLRIGYFLQSGDMTLPPVYERAIQIAKSALEASGHTVVQYAPPDLNNIYPIVLQSLTGDGGGTLLDCVKNDLVDKRALGRLDTILTLPYWLVKPLRIFLKRLATSFYNSLEWRLNTSRSVREWWECSAAKNKLAAAVLEDWKTQKLDGLLCPPNGGYAFPICSLLPMEGLKYGFVFNVLQCPAGVLPVTTVNKEEAKTPKNFHENGYINMLLNKGIENSEGLPICVQCAALPYRDEVCLRMMADIERSVKYI